MKEFIKAVNRLAMNCVVKVLKVDLRTGAYQIVYIAKGEDTSPNPLLDGWVKETCDKELIHPDYAEAFKQLINIEYFKKVFMYKKYLHLKFKRKSSQSCGYRNNVITVLPTDEKNANCICEEVYLIVYDIED